MGQVLGKTSPTTKKAHEKRYTRLLTGRRKRVLFIVCFLLLTNINRAYNLFRNAINRDMKNGEKFYWSTYFDMYRNDMKKTWKGIKELANIKVGLNSNISEINRNGESITDPKEIGNTFNNFFANVGPNTNKTIPRPLKSPTSYLRNRISLGFIIAYASEDEILKIIISLDDSKSSDPSSIPIRLLKIAGPYISFPLCKIVNLSFTTGIFPAAISGKNCSNFQIRIT